MPTNLMLISSLFLLVLVSNLLTCICLLFYHRLHDMKHSGLPNYRRRQHRLRKW